MEKMKFCNFRYGKLKNAHFITSILCNEVDLLLIFYRVFIMRSEVN